MDPLLTQQPMPRRARQVLNRLLDGKQLTDDGIRWLTKALDIFHDTPVKPTGLPDGRGTRSLVRELRIQTNVAKPTALVSGATWDLRVDNIPVLSVDTGSSAMVPSTAVDNVQAPAVNGGATARLHPGISINAFPTAANMMTSGDVVNNGNLRLPYRANPYRVVGQGFEIVNTTPELYRGGSLSMYKTPAHTNTSSILTNLGALVSPVRNVTGFPLTYNSVVIDPSTITHPATEGCYVPAHLDDVTNLDYSQPSVSALQVRTTDPQSAGQYCFANGSTLATTEVRTQCTSFSGAWLTGLHENSTFTVTGKYLVEELIPPTDSSLYPLTTPEPLRDDMALEIYSKAIELMPPGCKVADNPLGEWFNSVMDAVSNIAPTIGSFIPGVGPLIGGVVSKAAKAAGSYNRSLQEQERGAPPAPPPPKKSKPIPRAPLKKSGK